MDYEARANGDSLYKFVGAVLIWGVIISFVILVWGSILYLLNPGAPAAESGITGTIVGAARKNPSATINLGLFVLILTPVTRIIAAAIAFAMERRWKFVMISITVLAVLSVSVTYGTLRQREKQKESGGRPANNHSLKAE